MIYLVLPSFLELLRVRATLIGLFIGFELGLIGFYLVVPGFLE